MCRSVAEQAIFTYVNLISQIKTVGKLFDVLFLISNCSCLLPFTKAAYPNLFCLCVCMCVFSFFLIGYFNIFKNSDEIFFLNIFIVQYSVKVNKKKN